MMTSLVSEPSVEETVSVASPLGWWMMWVRPRSAS